MKISVGKQLFEKMDVAPFLEQKKELDTGFMGKLAELSMTHPMWVNRAHQIMKFAESDVYKHIVTQTA